MGVGWTALWRHQQWRHLRSHHLLLPPPPRRSCLHRCWCACPSQARSAAELEWSWCLSLWKGAHAVQLPATHAQGSQARRSWRAGHVHLLRNFCCATRRTWMARSTGPWQPLQQCWRVTRFLRQRWSNSHWPVRKGLDGCAAGHKALPTCTARISSKGHIGATAHTASGFMPQVRL